MATNWHAFDFKAFDFQDDLENDASSMCAGESQF